MSKPNLRSFLIAVLMLALIAACSSKQAETSRPLNTEVILDIPSATPTNSQLLTQSKQPDLSPVHVTSTQEPGRSSGIDFGENQITLWASGAIASSSAGKTAYHASQALGKPDTLLCGDFVTAWQPAGDSHQAWIELSYLPPIMPSGITIAQSIHPGQLSKVEVLTLDDKTITVFDASQEDVSLSTDCPVSSYFTLPEVDSLIRAVRIMVEREADGDWTQIDAVGVTGLLGEEPPDAESTPAWVDVDESEEFNLARHFSNANRIKALLFVGNTLWAGGDGGVVAWDLGDTREPAYVKASTFDTQALAYCDFDKLANDMPTIFAGGAQGIFTLHPSVYSENNFSHQPLEHLGDKDYGSVTALGCDNNNDLLWVGYTGHLSLYNPTDQTWLEYSIEDGLPADSVRQVKIIDGDAWVATADGVVVLRDGALINSYTPENSAIPSGFIHAIGIDEAMNIWMASSDGLISFDGMTWKLWSTGEIEGRQLSHVMLNLRMDNNGSLWLADHFGTICNFIPGHNKCQQVILPPESFIALNAFDTDQTGRLAIGSLNEGLWLYSEGQWISLRTRDQLSSNALRALAITPNGYAWLASDEGLQLFKTTQPAMPWISESLPVNARPFSFYVANDGLWIGHTSGARFIPYLSSEEIIDIHMVHNNHGLDSTVTAINRDADGLMYFGLGAGLLTWDGNELLEADLRSSPTKLMQPRVNTIYIEGVESWVGTSWGLFKFEKGKRVNGWTDILQGASSYGSASVGALLASPIDNRLLVSIGRELFLFDGEYFEKVLELPAEITSLYAGPYQLWLATASAGIYILPMDDTPAIYWDMASKINDLPDSFGYQAIAMSDAYTLWVASDVNGLTRLMGSWGQ